jgi:hypothetical protein
MFSYKVVTPVPGFRRDRVTGVQRISNDLKILDSGFRRNDGKSRFPTSYEFIKLHHSKFLVRHSTFVQLISFG